MRTKEIHLGLEASYKDHDIQLGSYHWIVNRRVETAPNLSRITHNFSIELNSTFMPFDTQSDCCV
jgi:hypothetical protein